MENTTEKVKEYCAEKVQSKSGNSVLKITSPKGDEIYGYIALEMARCNADIPNDVWESAERIQKECDYEFSMKKCQTLCATLCAGFECNFRICEVGNPHMPTLIPVDPDFGEPVIIKQYTTPEKYSWGKDGYEEHDIVVLYLAEVGGNPYLIKESEKIRFNQPSEWGVETFALPIRAGD